MPRRRTAAIAALSLAAGTLAAGTLAAQERVFHLGAPVMTAAEPLSRVAGLAELADGRFLVSDSKERSLHLASRDGRTVSPLGTKGEGPLEFRWPFGIVRGAGDTLLVYDSGNRRYLKVDAAGRIAGEQVVPPIFLTRGGLASPSGADDRGRLYWLGDVMDQPPNVKRRQSQNLRRWVPGRETFDTVAVASDHAPERHAHRFHPFGEADAVVVARDGRVGVLSARDYRLRWFADGKLVSEGPPIAHEPVVITGADRVAYRRERAQNVGSMTGGAGRAGGDPDPAALRRSEEMFTDEVFPRVKPPFVANGAIISPAGDVWVTRSGALGEERTRVDVINGAGVRRGHILLPAFSRLVALERNGVYLARTDDDGFEWVERYAWPAGLR